jgi:hypothetical protein
MATDDLGSPRFVHDAKTAVADDAEISYSPIGRQVLAAARYPRQRRFALLTLALITSILLFGNR